MKTLRFHGQFGPPADKHLFERFFPGLRGGLVGECGAFDGVLESSYLYLGGITGLADLERRTFVASVRSARIQSPSEDQHPAALSD